MTKKGGKTKKQYWNSFSGNVANISKKLEEWLKNEAKEEKGGKREENEKGSSKNVRRGTNCLSHPVILFGGFLLFLFVFVARGFFSPSLKPPFPSSNVRTSSSNGPQILCPYNE
jgi:hypothetical protein